MSTSHEFDVIVVGAGPVGENIADYARRGGLSVALIESDLVGGECSYWACIPSKALLRPVQALSAANRVEGASQRATQFPDAPAALARRDSFVSHYDDSGQAKWVQDAGVTLIRGRGRLSGERRVSVDGPEGSVELRARVGVALSTGTYAFVPPIEGLREAGPWTSREVTAMREVPARLAIIGGGVVACEMAAAVAGLGADRVTMLVRGDRLLPNVEGFASEQVLHGLRSQGVEVRFRTKVSKVKRAGGAVKISLDDGETVDAGEVLVATGRRPRTGEIGLETVGLTPGTPLKVDEQMTVEAVAQTEAGLPWLFAAGDVTGRAPLTHHGKYQARLLGERLASLAAGGDARRDGETSWGPFTATADTEALVQVIYTDPQVAAVGLTHAQALERGMPVKAIGYDLGAVAGAALHSDGYAGRVSILVDVEKEIIVGATLVGQDVGELLHAATIAVVGRVPLDRLWHAVPAFPTMSEVWLRLLEQWRGG